MSLVLPRATILVAAKLAEVAVMVAVLGGTCSPGMAGMPGRPVPGAAVPGTAAPGTAAVGAVVGGCTTPGATMVVGGVAVRAPTFVSRSGRGRPKLVLR